MSFIENKQDKGRTTVPAPMLTIGFWPENASQPFEDSVLDVALKLWGASKVLPKGFDLDMPLETMQSREEVSQIRLPTLFERMLMGEIPEKRSTPDNPEVAPTFEQLIMKAKEPLGQGLVHRMGRLSKDPEGDTARHWWNLGAYVKEHVVLYGLIKDAHESGVVPKNYFNPERRKNVLADLKQKGHATFGQNEYFVYYTYLARKPEQGKTAKDLSYWIGKNLESEFMQLSQRFAFSPSDGKLYASISARQWVDLELSKLYLTFEPVVCPECGKVHTPQKGRGRPLKFCPKPATCENTYNQRLRRKKVNP
jgi:hypothetical protein